MTSNFLELCYSARESEASLLEALGLSRAASSKNVTEEQDEELDKARLHRRQQEAVHMRTPDGRNALHRCVERGWAALADVIVDLGGSPLRPGVGQSQNAPLHLAARSGDPRIVKALLRAAELKQQRGLVDVLNSNGDTPLMFACASGHVGASALLLGAGADPARTNRDGLSPLSCACAPAAAESPGSNSSNKQRPEPARADKSSSSSSKGAASGCVTVLRLMLRHLTETNAASPGAIQPLLHCAVEADNAEAVEVLLEAGADPLLERSSSGSSALEEARRASQSRHSGRRHMQPRCLRALEAAAKPRVEAALEAASRDSGLVGGRGSQGPRRHLEKQETKDRQGTTSPAAPAPEASERKGQRKKTLAAATAAGAGAAAEAAGGGGGGEAAFGAVAAADGASGAEAVQGSCSCSSSSSAPVQLVPGRCGTDSPEALQSGPREEGPRGGEQGAGAAEGSTVEEEGEVEEEEGAWQVVEKKQGRRSAPRSGWGRPQGAKTPATATAAAPAAMPTAPLCGRGRGGAGKGGGEGRSVSVLPREASGGSRVSGGPVLRAPSSADDACSPTTGGCDEAAGVLVRGKEAALQPDTEASVRRLLWEQHPKAESLEIEPKHVLGINVSELSMSQLEALEEIHHALLEQLAEARVRLASQQRLEQRLEVQKLADEVHAALIIRKDSS